MDKGLIEEKVTNLVRQILDSVTDFELILLDETVTGVLVREKAKREKKENLLPAFSKEEESIEKMKIQLFSSIMPKKDIEQALHIPLAFLPTKFDQIKNNINNLSVRLQNSKKSLELIREEYPSTFLLNTVADSAWKEWDKQAFQSWYQGFVPKAKDSQEFTLWRRHPVLETVPPSPKPRDFHSILDGKLYWLEETVSYLLESVAIAKIRLEEKQEEFISLS